MSDTDFRSGANINELNILIDQFDELDRHEFDDATAMEVNCMKEDIFHITGCLSKMDQRFPAANEYMLLSGGLRTGSVHIDQCVNLNPVNQMEVDNQNQNSNSNNNNNNNNNQVSSSSISDNLSTSTNNKSTNNLNLSQQSELLTSPDSSSPIQMSNNLTIANRGNDYDLDYTLLVPVIKVSEAEHENSLILDMRKSESCHSWLVARPEIDEKLQLWEDCFVTGPPKRKVGSRKNLGHNSGDSGQNSNDANNEIVHDLINVETPVESEEKPVGVDDSVENLENGQVQEEELVEEEQEADDDLSNQLIYLCPILVAKWFSNCIVSICQNTEYLEREGKKGIPNIISCKLNAPGVTLILAQGGTRIQYDLIPVISFYGWPKVAGNWLNLPHIWKNIDNVSEITKGFHLIPPMPLNESILDDPNYSGNPVRAHHIMREWRFSFARSEVTIKRHAIPTLFMKSFYIFMAVMVKQLDRFRHVINPYSLRTIFFFAADRLPVAYLNRPDKVATNFLGLIDDVMQCLLTKSCPNYFINNFNIFGELQESQVKMISNVILMIRSDPKSFINEAVNRVRISRQQSSISRNARLGKKTDVVAVSSDGKQTWFWVVILFFYITILQFFKILFYLIVTKK